MSDGESGDDRPGRREVAVRVFAAEYDDASLSYSESDEERAPNYVVTPTGARVNRLFLVGVLTERERVNDEVLRARIADPTGAFVVYAGQYQPDALAFLERTDPPAFVAVTGKARTFEPDDGDRVYTSVRPESVSDVDADTRDRWVVRTAEQTLDRVATMADAIDRPERGDDLREVLREAGVDPSLAAGLPRALDHYGTTTGYLAAVREVALDAARVVAGDLEEVDPLAVAPDEGDDVDLDLDADVGTAVAGADAVDAGTTAGPTDATASEGETVDTSDASQTTGDGAAAEPTPTETPSDVARTESEAEERTALGDPVGTGTAAGQPSEPEPASEPGDTVETETETETEEMYEFDEEERREIEENYDMGFASGDDIPDAGEANIETPAPEEAETAEADEPTDAVGAADEREAADDELEMEDEEEPETLEEFTEEEYDEEDEAPGENVAYDLEDVVVEAMRDVGGGGGADRDAVVRQVLEEYDVTDGDVEDAIQGALMDGRCYESGENELTPI